MAAIRDKGVNFRNPYALFPIFTTPNASAKPNISTRPVSPDGPSASARRLPSSR